MKAYVIKNKAEDRYLYVFYVYEDENFAFGELNTAMLFEDVYNANIYVDKVKMLNSQIDCEVVEITIAEGDLQKENKILQKALELACLEHKKFGYCCYADPECDKTVLTCEECCAEYFKDRAKEKLNETTNHKKSND